MANLTPYDPVQHRWHYANNVKRSRYLVVAPAKMNLQSEIQGQVEMDIAISRVPQLVR